TPSREKATTYSTHTHTVGVRSNGCQLVRKKRESRSKTLGVWVVEKRLRRCDDWIPLERAAEVGLLLVAHARRYIEYESENDLLQRGGDIAGSAVHRVSAAGAAGVGVRIDDDRPASGRATSGRATTGRGRARVAASGDRSNGSPRGRPVAGQHLIAVIGRRTTKQGGNWKICEPRAVGRSTNDRAHTLLRVSREYHPHAMRRSRSQYCCGRQFYPLRNVPAVIFASSRFMWKR